MRLISTDDPAIRQQYIYLGPVGLAFPMVARLSSLVIGAALALVLSVVVYLLTPFVDFVGGSGGAAAVLRWATHAALAVAVGTAVAVLIVRRIGKHVTAYMPWQHHLETLLAEVRTPRPDEARATETLSLPSRVWLEQRPEHRTVRSIAPPAFLVAAAAEDDTPPDTRN